VLSSFPNRRIRAYSVPFIRPIMRMIFPICPKISEGFMQGQAWRRHVSAISVSPKLKLRSLLFTRPPRHQIGADRRFERLSWHLIREIVRLMESPCVEAAVPQALKNDFCSCAYPADMVSRSGTSARHTNRGNYEPAFLPDGVYSTEWLCSRQRRHATTNLLAHYKHVFLRAASNIL
jgi:hypothetical protein